MCKRKGNQKVEGTGKKGRKGNKKLRYVTYMYQLLMKNWTTVYYKHILIKKKNWDIRKSWGTVTASNSASSRKSVWSLENSSLESDQSDRRLAWSQEETDKKELINTEEIKESVPCKLHCQRVAD